MANAKPRSKSAKKSKISNKAVKYIQYMTMRPATLFLLNFFSFGLYELNWHYRNWKAIQANTREVMTPASRAIFPIFFVNRLFAQVSESARSKRYRKLHDPSGLAIIYAASFIAMGALLKIMATTPTTQFGKSFYLGVAIMLLLAARSLVLAIVQKGMNHYMNAIKQYAKPAGFSYSDIAVPVAGLALFGVLTAGLFMPSSFVNQSDLREYATRAAVHAAAARVQKPAALKPVTVNPSGNTSANGALGNGVTNPTTSHNAVKDNSFSPASTTPIQSGPYIGWTRYHNSDIGFSINSPKEVTIGDYGVTSASDPSSTTFVMDLSSDTTGRTIEFLHLAVYNTDLQTSARTQDSLRSDIFLSAPVTKKDVTVAGHKAILYYYDGDIRAALYLIEDGNRTFAINGFIHTKDPQSVANYWNGFDNTVASFTIDSPKASLN